jgi:hypothetical protein
MFALQKALGLVLDAGEKIRAPVTGGAYVIEISDLQAINSLISFKRM